MIGFRDRREAGRQLAIHLEHLRAEHPVVLALPRGGVPVAFEVARALEAPLDVIVVRKLGVPYQPELGMGAVGEGGVRVLNERVIRDARVTPDELAAVEASECAEVERRAVRYRRERPMQPLEGRTVIVIDDGLATGGTARAAVEVARAFGASRVVLAAPVAPRDTATAMAKVVDELVVLQMPSPFSALGEWYGNFAEVSDAEVSSLLAAAPLREGVDHDNAGPPSQSGRDEDVEIDLGPWVPTGRVTVPQGASGVVVFAHGTGSSRLSPRNQWVARRLHHAGLGTLLFDLLTPEESVDRANVFDVELLATRLLAVTRWLRRCPGCDDVPVGYFGASTGAAAALLAAADDPNVAAIVSRGGRPDLARRGLGAVQAPTLLIVGGADPTVARLNVEAGHHLRCEHRLDIVPGATHLFEEPGALEIVADLAVGWFRQHCSRMAATS